MAGAHWPTRDGRGIHPSEEGLPVALSAEDFGGSLLGYWRARGRQHTSDTYAGVRMSKYPEDLRVYEHLLWAARADAVIEIGAHFGGSALWFRDRLRAMTHYGRISSGRVISVDIDVTAARSMIAAADPDFETDIVLMQGDVRDPALPDAVTELIPPESRCFVVEDSAHTYETTQAALVGFCPLVPVGGYFVVEDGCVDVEELRAADDWPRGVLPVLQDWLATRQGAQFTVRRDLERYGLTCHPGGFLQRTAEASGAD